MNSFNPIYNYICCTHWGLSDC